MEREGDKGGRCGTKGEMPSRDVQHLGQKCVVRQSFKRGTVAKEKCDIRESFLKKGRRF